MKIEKIIIFLGILLLSSSALLMIVYYGLNVKVQYDYENAVRNAVVNESEVEDTSDDKSDAVIIEDEAIETLESDQKVKKVAKYKNVLEIPSLNIKAYIYEGTTKENLRNGLGHYTGTKQIGEKGKCCVLGHSSVTFNCILNGVENLAYFDRFNVWDSDGNKHIYYLTSKDIVLPTYIDVFNTEATDKSYFTLITCTDKGHKRLILNAVELTAKELKAEKQVKKDRINNDLLSIATMDVTFFELYDFFDRERS